MSRTFKILLVLLIAVAAIGAYSRGTFDVQLSKVGLNVHTCYKNMLTGATFCGDDAEYMRDHNLVSP